jgi:formate dehydrogenase major subunit
MSEIHLTIDGQSVVAESGMTILDAAKKANIDIPVLCHHPALENWGACRMCLVEVEGMRGLQTACTCPISEGMEVTTENENIANIRRFVLELLFSERNHYCMYCQMSGDCELQDQAYRYELDHWTYPRPYEKLEVDASRRYFIMDHNRCILCTRCIRACDEIAANHTLSLKNRGAESMIIADLDVPFGESSCIECGTCLQVCPTGALIDARSAYGGREKDVTHTTTTCMQCSVGCTLDVVTRYERLLRVDGVFGSEPNDGLLCVKGRFEPIYDEERTRVRTPLVRKDDKLTESSWEDALALVAEKLDAGKVLGLTSGATSNEALEAFAALFDKVEGTAGRLDAAVPELGYGDPAGIADVPESDFIVVAGADPLETHKVVGYFVKRAADNGATVALVGADSDLRAYADYNVDYADAGDAVTAALDAENPMVIYGTDLTEDGVEALKPLADKAGFLTLEPARNGKGAAAADLAPLTFEDADVVYLLMGEEAPTDDLLAQINGAFTVVQASYHSPLVDRADVVLPTPIWAERTGHVTNLEGMVLPLAAALEMPGEVRDDADVLADLVEKL